MKSKIFDIVHLFWSAVLLLLLVTGLAACAGLMGDAEPAPTRTSQEPTASPEPERGRGGTLRLVYWETPTTLNPHLSTAGKDWEASRLVYEPLASFNSDGELVPVLAAEIPSLEDGTVARDGTAVTWKLKQGIKWSDGTPFTAEDVKFTFEYITNPAVGAAFASTASCANVDEVYVINDYTLVVAFKSATAAWYTPFVGPQGMILPRHVFEAYNGSDASDAPANTLPVGTGPYRVVDGIIPQGTLFFGSQLVETNKIVYEPNPFYRDPDKPFFQRVELRGGGTPMESARLVLEKGTVDYAYNLTVDADALARMEAEGPGHVIHIFGSDVELIELNRTNPYQPDVTGERSSLNIPHPFFTDKRVRQAFAHAIDREKIAALYGDTGRATSNVLFSPPEYASPNTPFYEYDLERAKALLEEAGWFDSDNDGIREKDGQELSVLYQTGRTPVRVDILRLVRQSLLEIGVDVELRYHDISVFYGGTPETNPNAAVRFLADMQEWNVFNPFFDPDPLMRVWTSSSIPQKENNWRAGLNSPRWASVEYDLLYEQSTRTLDPEKRRDIFIQMNDMLVEDVVIIPVVNLARVSAISDNLTGFEPTPWDTDTWNIEDWRRSAS